MRHGWRSATWRCSRAIRPTPYEVIERTLGRAGSEQDDPWWTYPTDIRRTVPALLAAAYQALAGPAEPAR